MLETFEYFLLAATIVAALALICDGAYLTSRKHQVRKQPKVLTGAAGSGIVDGEDNPGPIQPASRSPKTKGLAWYGSAFTIVAFLLVTVYLIGRMSLTGHGPFANQHEFAVSFTWGILGAYLFFLWRYRIRMLSLVVMPVVLGLMIYAQSLDTGIEPLVPALQNNLLLTLHVSTAILAYGAACVSFGGAVLYLAHKPLSKKIRRMPSADLFDEIGYKAAVFTFPMLTIMILLGALWADTAWGRYWGWDPKETAAFVTWLLYGAYLHARVVRDWRGKRAAWLLIAGFIAVLFAYFGNHFFGGLHSYG